MYPVFGSGAKQPSTLPSTSKFISAEKNRLRNAFGTNATYEDRAAVQGAFSTVVTSPVRTTGFFLSKGAESLRPYELPGFGGRVQDKALTIISSQGRQAYAQPERTIIETVGYYGAGRAVGYVGGKVVTKVGQKAPATVGKYLPFGEAAVTTGLGGVVAYQAYTNPEGFGKSLLPSVAFGAGAFKGYRTTNPSPTVDYNFGRITSMKGRGFGSGETQFGLAGEGRVTVKYTQFGETTVRRPKYFVDMTSSPGTGLQAARGDLSVNARSYVKPFTINGREIAFSDSFKGLLRPPVEPGLEYPGGRAGVLALRSPRGRVLQTEFYPSGMFKKTASDTGTIAFRSTAFDLIGGGARIGRVVEGSSISESTPFRRTQFSYGLYRERYNIHGINSVQIFENPGLRESVFRSTSLRGRSLGVKSSVSGVQLLEPSTSTRGFGLLRQYGQFKESFGSGVRSRVGATREAVNEAFFPRRSRRLYSGMFFEPTTIRRPSTILEPASFGSRRAIPPLEGITPSARFGSRVGGFFPSINAGGSLLTLGSQRLTGVGPASSPLYKLSPLSSTTPVFDTSPAFKTVPSSAFDFGTVTGGGGTGVIGPSGPETPPPAFPGLPGLVVPLFGAGKGRGVEGRGRGRSFRYAPSFNAVLFNIKGRRPTGPLGGFETRPLLRGRR